MADGRRFRLWLRRFLADERLAYVNPADPHSELRMRSRRNRASSGMRARASRDSFRIAWTERRYQDGSLVETSRWSAILTTSIQPPRTPDALRRNPLGVFVTAISWSKELSQ